MRETRLTCRGWAALTIAAMMLGAGLGWVSGMGETPCDLAVSTVQC